MDAFSDDVSVSWTFSSTQIKSRERTRLTELGAAVDELSVGGLVAALGDEVVGADGDHRHDGEEGDHGQVRDFVQRAQLAAGEHDSRADQPGDRPADIVLPEHALHAPRDYDLVVAQQPEDVGEQHAAQRRLF